MLVFTVDAAAIRGQVVRPAQFGVRSETIWGVVFEDPNPEAMVLHCWVTIGEQKISGQTEIEVKDQAVQAGLTWSDEPFQRADSPYL